MYKIIIVLIIVLSSCSLLENSSFNKETSSIYSIEKVEIDKNLLEDQTTLKIQVFDRRTKKVISDALLIIDTDQSVFSDQSGVIKLDVLSGEHILKITRVGYSDLIIDEIILKSQTLTYLNIYLGTHIIYEEAGN